MPQDVPQVVLDPPASRPDPGVERHVYERTVAAIEALLASTGSGNTDLMRELEQASAVVADSLCAGDELMFHALNRRQAFSLAHHSANPFSI